MTKAYMVPNDGNVHHYTDTGGLIGILQGRKLWATNIQFLNDSLEYEFGLQSVTDGLRSSLAKRRDTDSEESPFTSELEDSVQTVIRLLKNIGTSTKDGQFVCCFSNYCDDLGQWRGYAQEGYCITFDRDKLTESVSGFQADKRSVKHQNVTYGDYFGWGWAPYMDSVLSRMHEILHKPEIVPGDYGFSTSDPLFGDLVREDDRNALAAMAGVAAVQNSILFQKEKGFADEQEMRICVSHPDQVNFRPSRIGPIPYTELKFDPECIKAVTVGPGLNIELRRSTLAYLLSREFGKDHEIEIKQTALSFRG